MLGVALDDAEPARLRRRHRDDGHRRVGLALDVEAQHLPDVHLVDVVGAEHADVRGTLVLDHVEVLQHGVGAALEEARPEVHGRRDRRDVVADLRRELPAASQVLHERARLVLRDHAQLVDAGVDEVRQHDVDDPVASAERHGGLGPVARQRDTGAFPRHRRG